MRNRVQYPVLNTRIKIYDTKTLYLLTVIEQLNDLYYGKDILKNPQSQEKFLEKRYLETLHRKGKRKLRKI